MKTQGNLMKQSQKTIELKGCPGCGGDCYVQEKKGQFQLTCFKFGCITIIASSLEEASRLWNEKRFAEVSR
jgi:hypothetical protein